MKKKYPFLVLAILLSGALLVGLGTFSQKNIQREVTLQTDPQVLSQWIDLDQFLPPKEVTFVQLPLSKGGLAPGPSDYLILAVLSYDQPTKEVTSNLTDLAPREVYLEEGVVKKWLPLSVQSRFSLTPNEHYQYQGQGYAAEKFLKSPLTYGWIIFEGNYIILLGGTS